MCARAIVDAQHMWYIVCLTSTNPVHKLPLVVFWLDQTAVTNIAHVLLLVVVDIDDRLLPLAGGDVAVEHDIDLTVRSVLHLRQEEVRKHQTDESGSAPDVSALAAEVAAEGIEHVRGDCCCC